MTGGEILLAEFGTEPHRIHGAALLCGDDVQCAFTGGTRPHIGAVSLALYEPERDSATVSTICAYGHRNDVLSARCAQKLSARLRCTVSVSVGIHMDNPAPEDLETLCQNCMECCARFLRTIEMKKEGDAHGKTVF